MVSAGDITLGLVAGGQGRRLGGVAKGLLDIGGRPSLRWLLDLAPGLGGVLLGATDASPYAAFGLESVADVVVGKGAPGGVVSLLLAAKTPWVLCVACDMPFVRQEHVEALRLWATDEVDVVVAARRGVSASARRTGAHAVEAHAWAVVEHRPMAVDAGRDPGGARGLGARAQALLPGVDVNEREPTGRAESTRVAPREASRERPIGGERLEAEDARGGRDAYGAGLLDQPVFEPLLGLYRSSLGGAWLPRLDQNPSLRGLVASSRWAAVELDPDVLDSLNTPDDLARARGRGG